MNAWMKEWRRQQRQQKKKQQTYVFVRLKGYLHVSAYMWASQQNVKDKMWIHLGIYYEIADLNCKVVLYNFRIWQCKW